MGGVIGAFVYLGASQLLVKLHVDDPIDAFAVHGACGAWGVLAAGIFDWGNGFSHAHGWSGFDCIRINGACGEDESKRLIGANFLEVLVICAWVAILSTMIFIPLK